MQSGSSQSSIRGEQVGGQRRGSGEWLGRGMGWGGTGGEHAALRNDHRMGVPHAHELNLIEDLRRMRAVCRIVHTAHRTAVPYCVIWGKGHQARLLHNVAGKIRRPQAQLSTSVISCTG